MALSTRTSTSLLIGLAEAENDAVWAEFDARYRPIVTGYCLKLGLTEHEAADVSQESLMRFLEEYRAGKYDRERGRLRSWLIGIVKYRVADLKRAKFARRELRGESAVVDLPDDDQLEALWEAERCHQLLRQAISELRGASRLTERTMRAFEMFAVEQKPAAAVAAKLGISVQDVYVAKNRVAARLRETLERLEALFDDR